MVKNIRKHASFILPIFILLLTSVWYIAHPIITAAEKNIDKDTEIVEKPIQDNTIVIHLDTNKLEIHNNGTTTTMELVSQGKPGSYYETIGGVYTSDYKIPLHFSSIGHVYMPFSVHLFGNYFIHGIPYYPDGTKVSSAFSGGCVRLNDYDAKFVYDFVNSTTTIIITRGDENEFKPTTLSTTTISSINMTRLMSAIISLEFLNQDNTIKNSVNFKTKTRLQFIPDIINNNTIDASQVYKDAMSDKSFVESMNNKAKSIGLSNTFFADVNSPSITSEEDYGRFMSHIITYKSYLNTVVSR